MEGSVELIKELLKIIPESALLLLVVIGITIFIIGFAKYGINFLKYGFSQKDNDSKTLEEIKRLEDNHLAHLKAWNDTFTSILLDKNFITNEQSDRLRKSLFD